MLSRPMPEAQLKPPCPAPHRPYGSRAPLDARPPLIKQGAEHTDPAIRPHRVSAFDRHGVSGCTRPEGVRRLVLEHPDRGGFVAELADGKSVRP